MYDWPFFLVTIHPNNSGPLSQQDSAPYTTPTIEITCSTRTKLFVCNNDL